MMTDQERVAVLEAELKKVLDAKNFCQKRVYELEYINISLRGSIEHLNKTIASIYSVLNLASIDPPED